MRNYGKVAPTFWTRGSGKRLRGNAAAQVVAMYLSTAPSANMIGLYYVSVATIASDTGLSHDETVAALVAVEVAGYARYDFDAELVWVINHARIEIGDTLRPGDKRRPRLMAELDQAGDHPFVPVFVRLYRVAYGLTFRCPIEGASTVGGCSIEGTSLAPSGGSDLSTVEPLSPTLRRGIEGASAVGGWGMQVSPQDQDQDQVQDNTNTKTKSKRSSPPTPSHHDSVAVVTGELPSPAAPAPNGSGHVGRTESQARASLSPAPVSDVVADCGAVAGPRNAFRSEDGQSGATRHAKPAEGNVVGFASEPVVAQDAPCVAGLLPTGRSGGATNHPEIPNGSNATSGIVGPGPQSRLSLLPEGARFKAPARARESTQGTRLDPSWTPEPEPALESGVDVLAELAKFRDYWTAVAGQRGRKLAWQATWRTWLRNAAEFRGRAAPRKAAAVRQPASGGWAKDYEFKNLFED